MAKAKSNTSDETTYVLERLSKKHDRRAFSCGVEPLDRYLQKQAGQEMRRNVAVTFVLTEKAAPAAVIGYFTLSGATLKFSDLPEALSKKLPRYDSLPTTLIGRLAVDSRQKGKKLGDLLLRAAFGRALETSKTVASWAIVVDAKDETVRSFYQRYGFRALEDRPLHLYLPMKDVERIVAGASIDS